MSTNYRIETKFVEKILHFKTCLLGRKGGRKAKYPQFGHLLEKFHLLSTYLQAYTDTKQTMKYSFWRFYVQEPGEPEIPECGEGRFPPSLPLSERGRLGCWGDHGHIQPTPALFVQIIRRVPISAYFGEGFVLGTSVHLHLARAQVHFTRNTKQLLDSPGFGWIPNEHNPPGHQGGGAPVPILHLRMYPVSKLWLVSTFPNSWPAASWFLCIRLCLLQ